MYEFYKTTIQLLRLEDLDRYFETVVAISEDITEEEYCNLYGIALKRIQEGR